MMTNCENCSAEIPEEEAQMCDCGFDGLGNCCIAPDAHDCEQEESGPIGDDGYLSSERSAEAGHMNAFNQRHG